VLSGTIVMAPEGHSSTHKPQPLAVVEVDRIAVDVGVRGVAELADDIQ